jgi:hypothetical protein
MPQRDKCIQLFLISGQVIQLTAKTKLNIFVQYYITEHYMPKLGGHIHIFIK